MGKLKQGILDFFYSKASDFEKAYFEDFIISHLGWDFFMSNELEIYQKRNINYVYPNWVSPQKAYKMFINAGVSKYNEFDANVILKIGKQFPNVKIKPARLYSACLYLKGVSIKDILPFKEEYKADAIEEVDLQGEKVIRIWWD